MAQQTQFVTVKEEVAAFEANLYAPAYQRGGLWGRLPAQTFRPINRTAAKSQGQGKLRKAS